MTDDRAYLLSRIEEAEAVIRKLLLSTTYEQFERHRRGAEKTMFTLRQILDAQNREVCQKLDAMRVQRG